ncbi:MAG: LysR substrate-binding domain-containing protein [Reyranellaceae bacterium]
MTMNLAFVRYFLAVVETGAFTAAAARVHVTQPTLSAGIARLEELLGARLFERQGRVRLTEGGERFLPRARSMLAEWAAAESDARRPPQRLAARLGIAPSLPVKPVTTWLASCAADGFDIEAVQAAPDILRERLRRGRLDAALLPITAGEVRAIALFHDPFRVALATHHAFAAKRRCTIADLAHEPFVIRPHCPEHETARRAFAAKGARPRVALRTTDDDAAMAAVAAGVGACFVPASLARAGCALLAVKELPTERRIGLVCSERLEPMRAERLRRLAQAVRWP